MTYENCQIIPSLEMRATLTASFIIFITILIDPLGMRLGNYTRPPAFLALIPLSSLRLANSNFSESPSLSRQVTVKTSPKCLIPKLPWVQTTRYETGAIPTSSITPLLSWILFFLLLFFLFRYLRFFCMTLVWASLDYYGISYSSAIFMIPWW